MMIFWVILGFVTSFGIGIFIGGKLEYSRLLGKSKKIRRRGLITDTYNNSINGNYNVFYQVGEIENSNGMSKVVVFSVKTEVLSINDNVGLIKQFHKAKHNEWVDENSVKWLDNDIRQRRNEVLSEILD